MKVSYYPGCSLEETAEAFDLSVRNVCNHLDVSLEEVPGWSCCGSSPALKMDHLLSTSLAAHNLALVSKQQAEEMVIPCPFCFRRLLSAQQETQATAQTREAVQEAIMPSLCIRFKSSFMLSSTLARLKSRYRSRPSKNPGL